MERLVYLEIGRSGGLCYFDIYSLKYTRSITTDSNLILRTACTLGPRARRLVHSLSLYRSGPAKAMQTTHVSELSTCTCFFLLMCIYMQWRTLNGISGGAKMENDMKNVFGELDQTTETS
jgi:hypothetical protein